MENPLYKTFIQVKEWTFPPSQKLKLAVESSWQGIRNSSTFLCWNKGRGFVPLSLSVLAYKKLHQVIFQMAETPLTGKGNAILLREVYMYIFPLVLISSRSTYAQAYSRFRIKLHFFAISSFLCYATTIWKVPSISR